MKVRAGVGGAGRLFVVVVIVVGRCGFVFWMLFGFVMSCNGGAC